MIATTIRTPPSAADFLPLAEYQSQTPESFVDGKPVLHLHITGAAASAPKEQLSSGSLAVFPADSPAAPAASGENGADVPAEELVEQQVDVYVTSECVGPIASSKADTVLNNHFVDIVLLQKLHRL